MDLKSRQNGRYNIGEKKGSFCFKKKQTNERNETERKVLWEEKENDERERGPEIKGTELRQRLFLKKKGSEPRDQNKESKKLGKDTHLKEDDSEKTMFTKSL